MNILRRKKTPPTSSSTTTTSPLARQEDDGFEARPSRRASDDIKADGSIWQETLAVCELGGELTIRSYYTNLGSAEREWDEPPSGASQILHATDEMRRMAQAQLEEMQVICAPTSTEPEEQPKKKKGLLRGFTKNKSDKKKESWSGGKIQYKKNSFMHGDKQRDEVMDPHVQAAIALSMADQTSGTTTTPDEEDDLAMATALSLSQREEESKMDVLQWEVSPPQLYAERKTFQDDTFNVTTAVEPSQPSGGLKTWPPPDHHEQQESAPASAAAAAPATLKTWPPPKTSGVV